MALPTGDMAWPPADMAAEISRVSVLARWYAGDSSVADPGTGGTAGGWASPIPAQGRRWWQPGGRPTVAGTGRVESHPMRVPLAADIARTSADLLFSALPAVTVDPRAQARWEQIEDEGGWEAMLPESAELCAALSGMYWRVILDPASEPRWPVVSWVHPDNAWPEWVWGHLRAVTFVRILPAPTGTPERVIYRHLERHSASRAGAMVEHGLYIGESSKLGTRVPLTDHPDTAEIAPSLTGEEGIIMSGVTRTAGYIPNMLPNRLNRGSRLGRPDIEQQEDLLRAINETWTSWMRDLRLGKARIIVPGEYLTPGTPGTGAVFDVDREVYSSLRMMPPSGSDPASAIKVNQFDIRFAEHEATLRALIQQVVTGAGYNLHTVGMGGDSGPAVTATEVDARTDLSVVTKGKKSRYWRAGLRELVSAVLTADAFGQYRGSVVADPTLVDVEIDTVIAPRPAEVAQTANLLAQARAASTQTLVELVHPDWSAEEVRAEVALIQQEQGVPVADPDALGVAPADDPAALLADVLA